MTTYVFTRTSESANWSPRTSYPDNWQGARRRTEKIIAEEYETGENGLTTGVTLVYFASGSIPGGDRPQDMPEIHQFRVERVTPKLIEVA